MTSLEKPRTVGELRASGYKVLPVREEMRKNLIGKIRKGEPLFSGIVGYEDTVIPALENAILAGQDIIFLGERGQAKTRIARALINLLDEEVPVLVGSEVNDDPLAPISGVVNAIVCRAEPVGEVLVAGPGAGPNLAGQGVFSDLIAVAQ